MKKMAYDDFIVSEIWWFFSFTDLRLSRHQTVENSQIRPLTRLTNALTSYGFAGLTSFKMPVKTCW